MSEEMSWSITSGCFGKVDIHRAVGEKVRCRGRRSQKKVRKWEINAWFILKTVHSKENYRDGGQDKVYPEETE